MEIFIEYFIPNVYAILNDNRIPGTTRPNKEGSGVGFDDSIQREF